MGIDGMRNLLVTDVLGDKVTFSPNSLGQLEITVRGPRGALKGFNVLSAAQTEVLGQLLNDYRR